MRGPMAGETVRRIQIACRGRFSVNALLEFLHFIGMALRALCRCHLGRRCHLVGIAVAG